MQYNNDRNFKIGKVINFDGLSGEIVTPEGIDYYFVRGDIVHDDNRDAYSIRENDYPIENDDIVQFNGKTESTFPQAYFVKKIGFKKTK